MQTPAWRALRSSVANVWSCRTWSPASQGQRLDQSSNSELESMLLWTWSLQSLNRTRCRPGHCDGWHVKIYHHDRETQRQLDRQTKNFRPLCQRLQTPTKKSSTIRAQVCCGRLLLMSGSGGAETLRPSSAWFPCPIHRGIPLGHRARRVRAKNRAPSRPSARQRQQQCFVNAQDDHAWLDGMVTQHDARLLST